MTDEYQQAWDALSGLIRRGASFSGHERNCAFLNLGSGTFANVAAAAGLDLPDDGRALATTDFDADGDLDFWLANRTGPQLRLLRNDLPAGRHYLQLRLHGTTSNRDAVGARAELRLASGATLVRAVRSGEGFLAQSSKWLHFGLGAETAVAGLTVRWPSGLVQELAVPAVDRRWDLAEGAEHLVPTPPPPAPPEPAATAAATNAVTATATDNPTSPAPAARDVAPAEDVAARGARLFLAARVPLPESRLRDAAGSALDLDSLPNQPRLVVLWASWCRPCVAELQSLVERRTELAAAGLDVLAVSTDALGGTSEDTSPQARQLLARLAFPWTTAWIDEELVARWEHVLRHLSDRWRPLGVPTSLLLDGQGWIAAVYFGPLAVEQVLADARVIDLPPAELKEHAVPFAGRWSYPTFRVDLGKLAGEMRERGSPADGLRYLRADLAWYRRLGSDSSEADLAAAADRLAEALGQTAREALAARRPALAAEHFAERLKLRPDDVATWNNWGTALGLAGRWHEAAEAFREACRRAPDEREPRTNLAGALERLGDPAAAVAEYETLLARDPQAAGARNNLAWLRATHREAALRHPEQATNLAEALCRESDYRHAGYLDTLAAAYAAQGLFDRASDVAARAVELARLDQPELSAAIAARLELYRQGRPYVDERPAAAAEPASVAPSTP